MKMLNCCLLEGKVRDSKKENDVFMVVVETVQDEKKSCFYVKTYGQLAKFCEEKYNYGRKIRVVGKLDQGVNGVFINAENIDFDIAM